MSEQLRQLEIELRHVQDQLFGIIRLMQLAETDDELERLYALEDKHIARAAELEDQILNTIQEIANGKV